MSRAKPLSRDIPPMVRYVYWGRPYAFRTFEVVSSIGSLAFIFVLSLVKLGHSLDKRFLDNVTYDII